MLKKFVFFIFILSIAIVSFTGCPNPIYYSRWPDKFPNSKWSTTDESICFYVNENFEEFNRFLDNGKISTQTTNIKGEILHNGNKGEFYLLISDGGEYQYFISANITKEPLYDYSEYNSIFEKHLLATLSVDYKSTKHFKATVVESKIPGIEEGTVFHFYRTTKGTD